MLRNLIDAVLPAELASTLRVAAPAWLQCGVVDPNGEDGAWTLSHSALAYLDVLRSVSAT